MEKEHAGGRGTEENVLSLRKMVPMGKPPDKHVMPKMTALWSRISALEYERL